MTLEKKVNSYGQEQIIENFDKIIKIDGQFLQVRLIKTKKWSERDNPNGGFTCAMPRARFVNPKEDFCYVVARKDLIALKKRGVKR
jgi:hypothetical protein